ncbi:hypothetical protein LIA77_02978 [Sarocladium implicatum]|nr:hypothetical protein LIA77_02978 [Sarocladium implicatum]
MASRFRFITIVDPTAPASAETRSATHSHAISHVHARRKHKFRKECEQRPEKKAVCTKKKATAPCVQPASILCGVPNDSSDPFQTLALPLSEQDYFLLSYYHRVAVPFATTRCDVFDQPNSSDYLSQVVKCWTGRDAQVTDGLPHGAEGDPRIFPDHHSLQIYRDWMEFAVSDGSLLLGAVLLAICRYILNENPDNTLIAHLAIKYQQSSIQALQRSLTTVTSQVSIQDIARAIALALDATELTTIGIADELGKPEPCMEAYVWGGVVGGTRGRVGRSGYAVFLGKTLPEMFTGPVS